MPGPRIEIEDDPTPLVRALGAALADRLRDPDFTDQTTAVHGTVVIRVGATPEAATIVLGEAIEIRHGVARADATATLDARARWDGGAIEREEEYPEIAGWLRAFAAPPERPWREAAARFWAALEPSPGAPPALQIDNLETGESERFGADGRAYVIQGRTEPLVALLEGRASLIEEAFERRVFIRGSFPEISVLTGAALRVRLQGPALDA